MRPCPGAPRGQMFWGSGSPAILRILSTGRPRMGMLDSMMGSASEISPAHFDPSFSQMLAEGEVVERVFLLFRDFWVFTDRRLVLVDKQGIRGKKVEYLSIPYRSISHFAIETEGNWDLDAELRIWIAGTRSPVKKRFNKKLNIYMLQSVLAGYVLR